MEYQTDITQTTTHRLHIFCLIKFHTRQQLWCAKRIIVEYVPDLSTTVNYSNLKITSLLWYLSLRKIKHTNRFLQPIAMRMFALIHDFWNDPTENPHCFKRSLYFHTNLNWMPSLWYLVASTVYCEITARKLPRPRRKWPFWWFDAVTWYNKISSTDLERSYRC